MLSLMALKVLGVEVEIILFPGEDHYLKRSVKPKHRLKRLEKILDRLEDHLR